MYSYLNYVLTGMFLGMTMLACGTPEAPVPAPPASDQSQHHHPQSTPHSTPLTTFEIRRARSHSISIIREKVDILLARGADPRSIVVVVDVDGTLTNYSRPPVTATVRAREDSLEIVRNLIQQNIHLVVSSAWNGFEETLVRLRAIGLAADLHLQDTIQSTVLQISVQDHLTSQQARLNYFRNGLVASVQNSAVDTNYFRQKALAPLVILRPEELSQIRYIISVDDSTEDTSQFVEDLARFRPFGPQLAEAHLIELTPVHGNIFIDRGGITFFARYNNREAGYTQLAPYPASAFGYWPSTSHIGAFEILMVNADGTRPGNPILIEPSTLPPVAPSAPPVRLGETPVYVASDRVTALAQIHTLQPGEIIVWRSISSPGSLGIIFKKYDGSVPRTPFLLNSTSAL